MPQQRESPTHPGGSCPRSELRNGRGGFLHKERSEAAAHVLEGELENMPTSGEHSCVTQTCVCDVFLDRRAKKASSQEPDRNKCHAVLLGGGVSSLPANPNPSWWVTRAPVEFLKRFTEELLEDPAVSLRRSQDTHCLIVQEFVLSSCWRVPTCNLRGWFFLPVCGKQRDSSLRAQTWDESYKT